MMHGTDATHEIEEMGSYMLGFQKVDAKVA
jgi:hypothetical protein